MYFFMIVKMRYLPSCILVNEVTGLKIVLTLLILGSQEGSFFREQFPHPKVS